MDFLIESITIDENIHGENNQTGFLGPFFFKSSATFIDKQERGFIYSFEDLFVTIISNFLSMVMSSF